MGFKVDTSFLRFLTMGAAATKRVMELMDAAGLRPMELERYSSSNKIWSTKVKRLRLPDLVCVRTGLRVEVRAKSVLEIKMSDAPENPDRRWHSGLVGEDMVAFVQCTMLNSSPLVAPNAELFWVQDLLDVPEAETKLGPPKSASEGSERDRTWPSCVAKQDGQVLDVTPQKIRTQLPARKQTYSIAGKHSYVSAGDSFRANTVFLAGAPASKASFQDVVNRQWDPRDLLGSQNAIDRYVCAKALSIVGLVNDGASLQQLMADADKRVALEAAGSLVKLGFEDGLTYIRNEIRTPSVDFLRMEAVFLLGEMRDSPLSAEAVRLLVDTASDAALAGDEVRQAAIWSLGRAGLRTFSELLPFLDSDVDDERMHALVAFGPELPPSVTQALVDVLAAEGATQQAKASAAFVLSHLDDVSVALPALVNMMNGSNTTSRSWAISVIGSMNPILVAAHVHEPDTIALLHPTQLTTPHLNWTRKTGAVEEISFLSKQVI